MTALRHALASLFALVALPGRPLWAAGEGAIAPTITLEAELVSPIDVRLHWTDRASETAGHTVEFCNTADGTFIILAFLPPGVSEYMHPRLIPRTQFYYRVRGIYGPASNAVEAAIPPLLSDAEYAAGYAGAEDYSWAPPRFDTARAAPALVALRAPDGAKSAPGDLGAVFMTSTVSGFQFTWTDRATGSDGYLLERQRTGEPTFTVCAVAPPHTNTFGWALVPPERKARFRVRPFYYGAASNLVNEMTGDGHPEAPRPAR